jgi:hypothetical protein
VPSSNAIWWVTQVAPPPPYPSPPVQSFHFHVTVDPADTVMLLGEKD